MCDLARVAWTLASASAGLGQRAAVGQQIEQFECDTLNGFKASSRSVFVNDLGFEPPVDLIAKSIATSVPVATNGRHDFGLSRAFGAFDGWILQTGRAGPQSPLKRTSL